MATARTSPRSRLKGRSRIAIGLLAFIAITSLVVWRRSVGVKNAKAIQIAMTERRALLSERSTLEREIDNAQKRERVMIEAQRRLGLHVASDSQTRVLVAPADSR